MAAPTVNLKAIFDRMLVNISARNMYSGAPVADSIMRMLQVEIRKDGGGVTAPYWLSVTERGRGPRRSTKDHGLVQIIYKWMAKHNLFESDTAKGKLNEARGMTWYINKYGNKQFREGAFVDIYTTARKQTITEIEQEYSVVINRITMDII